MKKGGNSPRILFITGTDTGAGKTLLTGLLLHHLRESGVRALAAKPFCSGGTRDVVFLNEIQNRELTRRQINPFYFRDPVAPLVAGRQRNKLVPLPQVLTHLRKLSAGCEVLLVEGSGGLLVPLGEGYSVADLIAHLDCEVLVAAQNKLGTINHTLLTVRGLQNFMNSRRQGGKNIKVVLMNHGHTDESCSANGKILRELLAPVPLLEVPFLGRNASSVTVVQKKCKKIAKTLASIFE
jgi:dethiobiotin synthetase